MTVAFVCLMYDGYTIGELWRLKTVSDHNDMQIAQGMRDKANVIRVETRESDFYHGILGSNLENYYYYSEAGDIQFVMENSDEQ